MSFSITLNLYDISQGEAKRNPTNVSGHQIEGIWQSGLVIYNKEYYYGRGICKTTIGNTPFGKPVERIDLGHTEVPEEMFMEFLQQNQGRFNEESFNIFTHSSNDFADECLDFLTGNRIPDFLKNAPQGVMTTHLGKTIQPYIQTLTQNIKKSTHSIFQTAAPSQVPGVQNYNQAPPVNNPGAGAANQPVTNYGLHPSNFKNFKLLHPGTKEYYTFGNINFTPAIENINKIIENYPIVNEKNIRAIFNRFAENPQGNLKNFSADDKAYLVNWIFETILYIGISDKTIGFLDLLRMLSVDSAFLEIIIKNEDKLYQIFRLLGSSEKTLEDLPKGLKTVLIRFLANLVASDKSKHFFGNNLGLFIGLLVRAAGVYKEDKVALVNIFRVFWNLLLNFTGYKELFEALPKLSAFSLQVFNETEETELLLACSLVIGWLSYYYQEVRNEAKEKIDKAKVAKLEFSENMPLGNLSRDINDLLQH